MNITKSKRVPKLSPMKTMRLADASRKLEGIRFEQTRELTPDERASWERATRRPGRPRKPAGEKAARVLVTSATHGSHFFIPCWLKSYKRKC